MYLIYNEAGADLGPYSIDDLRRMFASGEIPRDKLVRETNSKTWMTLPAILPEAVAPVATQSSASYGTAPTPSSAIKRYRDAYLVASAAIAFAAVIKMLGWVVAIITWIAGFILASQQREPQMGFMVAALISGVVQLIVFYFFGVLVAAAGQILRATLDTAVHSSPFLDDQQKAAAIGV